MRRPLGVHKQRRSCNYCHVKVRLAVGALCAVTVLAVSGIAIATPTAGTQLSAGAPSTPPTADLDGDKVFDDLAAELKGADAGDVVSVIVRLNDKLTRARAASIEQSVGTLRYDAWLPIIDGFAATVSKSQVAALASLEGVRSVEKNGTVHALNNSAQASFGVSQARLHQPTLDGDRNGNANQYVPDDVVVAVIDTGIDADPSAARRGQGDRFRRLPASDIGHLHAEDARVR